MKPRPILPPVDPGQRYSIEEAIAYLRSSRKTVYDDIHAKRLLTIQEGRRRFVPGSELPDVLACRRSPWRNPGNHAPRNLV